MREMQCGTENQPATLTINSRLNINVVNAWWIQNKKNELMVQNFELTLIKKYKQIGTHMVTLV